ncbi:MAG: hypothetical protein LBV12_06525 [Puniceicoccales bacterium]|jgi:hypothetical protein|nr:hypothetical protein [Puniceicoccales bacterium]
MILNNIELEALRRQVEALTTERDRLRERIIWAQGDNVDQLTFIPVTERAPDCNHFLALVRYYEDVVEVLLTPYAQGTIFQTVAHGTICSSQITHWRPIIRKDETVC